MSLTVQPTAPVTVAVTSSNTGEGTVSSSFVTFTLDDFDQPHIVTITGVNDGNQNSVPYTIILSARSAATADTTGSFRPPSR